MPIPLLVWAAIAAVSALAAGAAGIWLFSEASGKSVVLLGERSSGKSTFYSFLQSGVIPAGYTPTTEATTFEKEVEFKDYELKLRVTDLSGAKAEWSNWEEQARQANLVCFLASWEHLTDRKGQVRVKRCAKQVGSWKIDSEMMLVVTFLDKASVPADALISDRRVRSLKQLLNAKRVVAVDQTNEASRHHLGYQTLKALG